MMTQSHDGQIHDPKKPTINHPSEPPKIHRDFPINPDADGDADKKPSSAVTNTVASATNETRACAACKYQRRRCTPGCALAPYFPPDHQKQFLNAHKLFGLRNMMKVYKQVKPNERETSMKTMIFEADIRAQNPVGGCYQIIDRLQKEIQFCKAELSFYLNQLAIFQNLNASGGSTSENSAFPSASASASSGGSNKDPSSVVNIPNTEFKGFDLGFQSMLFQPETGDEFGVSMADFYQATYGDVETVAPPCGGVVNPAEQLLLGDGAESIQGLLINNPSKRIKSDLIKQELIVPKSENDVGKNKVQTNRQTVSNMC
ncbi:OLC1v1029259C1 [Oldenlandia corymbosa var. corymbosa]|uniref:OLC1v1029259C1 n=1 Tax=Oldenlandia corymbosa var. corymbosa TaxID=529605 RepID=A0AAV1CE96_OLDCO|nr:OLC1v1029259C1 [Oldenlandia corymbosa var. corymbosa]